MIDSKHKKSNMTGWSSIKTVIKFGGNFIDYKIGFLGAGFMGILVYYINYSSTEILYQSIIAGSKQAVYTFFFGGSIMKACEYLATNIKIQYLALITGIVVPSIITLSLTFGVHKLKGTPLPVESTIPTLLIIPATAVWGYKKRKEIL